MWRIPLENIKTKVAMAYTVRNERRLLFQNMACHRRLGVKHFFVFWDKTEDDAPLLAKRFSDVTGRETVCPEELDDPFLKENFTQLSHVDIRKVFNSTWAARKAREMGFDWLICLDPDEIIVCDFKSPKKAQIDLFLENYSKHFVQVIFNTFENLPMRVFRNEKFSDCSFFLKNDTFFLRCLRVFWDISHLESRQLFHPEKNSKLSSGRFFLGHNSGKSAFCLKYLDYYWPFPHAWKHRKWKNKGDVFYANALLHYYTFDCSFLRNKFQNYIDMPNNVAATSRPRREHDILLQKLANTLSDQEFWEYYCQNIAFDPKKLPFFMRSRLIFLPIVRLLYEEIPEEELCLEKNHKEILKLF